MAMIYETLYKYMQIKNIPKHRTFNPDILTRKLSLLPIWSYLKFKPCFHNKVELNYFALECKIRQFYVQHVMQLFSSYITAQLFMHP